MRPFTDEELGFCPFCRQAFEGAARCPDHDLALVSAHLLPRSRASADDDVVPFFAIGRGRFLVFVGALLVLVGFLAPSFVDPSGVLEPKSGLGAAVSTAPVLWLVPAAAALVLSFAARRGRVRELRRSRIGLASLAWIAAAVELYVVHRVVTAAPLRASARAIELGAGVPLVLVGAGLATIGAILLGRR
jgi:hypothetical protein